MTESTPSSDRYRNIVERLSEGVVVLNDKLVPLFANRAATEMLGLDPSALPPRLPSQDLLTIARRTLEEDGLEETLRLWFPRPRTLFVTAVRLEGNEVLLALRDITEEVLAQQIRTEFVEHASHELKSPVAGLQALAGAISQALHDDPEAVGRFADRLNTEADRLGRLINDLLDLSKLEEPATLPDDPVDLSAVVEGELETARSEMASKNMGLDVSVPDGVWVRGDRQQLELLVRNLLDNAIRYTREGGHIAVDLRRDGDSAQLSVRDDGIGIPMEAQKRVFERFYRVDRARSRDRGGTGLGLAIVKHVAELHGGNVTLQSELGVGSVFVASLPALPFETIPMRSTGS